MNGLAWGAYILGGILVLSAQIDTGGLILLFGVLIHWRWWVIAIPLWAVAFTIGLNGGFKRG